MVAPGEGSTRRLQHLRDRARQMRSTPTDAEQRMWYLLRDRRLSGLKFRRQVPIGRYIVDFVSFSARLIVELDGSQHNDSVHDRVRDAELQARGFEIMRFWNNDVLANTANVLETIWQRAERKGTL